MTHLQMLKEAFSRIKSLKGIDLAKEGWRLAYNRRTSAFGICSYTRKTIYLSKVLSAARTEAEIFNTILHEAAHAALPGHKHDRVWVALFKQIGGNGQKCSDTSKEVRDVMEARIRYHLIDSTTGRVLKKFYRRPRVDFSNHFVIGRPETKGMLKIVEV